MMWEGDLTLAVPAAAAVMEPVAAAAVTTHGSTRNGRLAHPATWPTYLGMTAFYGAGHPHRSPPFWTDKPVVTVTAAQMFRDCWAHDYVIIFNGRWVIWDGTALQTEKLALLYHARGYRILERQVRDAYRAGVTRSLQIAVSRLAHILEETRDGSIELVSGSGNGDVHQLRRQYVESDN